MATRFTIADNKNRRELARGYQTPRSVHGRISAGPVRTKNNAQLLFPLEASPHINKGKKIGIVTHAIKPRITPAGISALGYPDIG